VLYAPELPCILTVLPALQHMLASADIALLQRKLALASLRTQTCRSSTTWLSSSGSGRMLHWMRATMTSPGPRGRLLQRWRAGVASYCAVTRCTVCQSACLQLLLPVNRITCLAAKNAYQSLRNVVLQTQQNYTMCASHQFFRYVAVRLCLQDIHHVAA
jgi:hypothetical protein